MKALLFLFILQSACLSSVFAETKFSENPALSKKIINLFELSKKPYPLEEIAMSNEHDSSKFKGCILTNLAGKTGPIKGMFVIKMKVIVKEDNGPLDPEIVNNSLLLVEQSSVDELLRVGLKFNKGVIDVDSDPYAFTNPTDGCVDHTTLLEAARGAYSGLSEDKKSHLLQSKCNDGKLINVVQIREWGGLLVFKEISVADQPIYGYCWKK